MAWFKVDDGFYSSLKFLSIQREVQVQAAGAWLLAGTWAADKMTDGFVPYSVMDLWVFPAEVVQELCRVGLWIHDEEASGIMFHDWNEYQPTRSDLELKREKVKSARTAAGVKSGEARRQRAEQNGNKTGTKSNKREQSVNPEPEPEPEPLTVVNTNNVTVAESGRNDIVDINQLKLKAALRAEEMGLKEIPVIRNHIERVLEVRLNMDHTLELVAFILATAKGSVKNVDAYLVTVCKRNPEAIRNAWIQLDLVS